ncbi:hypothetical protein OG195_27235 [Streptomyces sp. NBC_01362]|uniref:hypothetical protein n=1 Tax=Streptomyces sp. NBC_01362 TaxID=2903839 RepID=UPI002E335A34|nr:hypothetical protein [Streptomyces sp. NBC_01362]
MALINPPAWMQAGSYPARTDRLVIASMLSYPGFLADEATPLRIRQGVRPSYTNQQLKVRAAPTPNMTVLVSAGMAFIDQHDAGGSGTYVCINDSDATLTIQPSGGAGQFRRDAVVASVYDAETAGSVSEWRLEVIQGAYAASAGATVRPSLPPNAQLLADVAVGASVTSISSANISDFRQYSVGLGGVLPTSSAGAPPRPHPGQVIYQMDTDLFEVGLQAGGKRQVREQIRPVVSDQVSQPGTLVTGSFTDFTSAQWPPVTVTVPPSGMVRITIGAAVANSDSPTATAWVRWRSTGALTETTAEANAISTYGSRNYGSRTVVRSGMTPGASLTIIPQYNVSSVGANTRVSNGQLIVEPIA